MSQVRFLMRQEKTNVLRANHQLVNKPPLCQLSPHGDSGKIWVRRVPGAAALAGETDVAGNATIGKLDENVSRWCLVSARFDQILAIFVGFCPFVGCFGADFCN